jgi:hypothetical protein
MSRILNEVASSVKVPANLFTLPVDDPNAAAIQNPKVASSVFVPPTHESALVIASPPILYIYIYIYIYIYVCVCVCVCMCVYVCVYISTCRCFQHFLYHRRRRPNRRTSMHYTHHWSTPSLPLHLALKRWLAFFAAFAERPSRPMLPACA